MFAIQESPLHLKVFFLLNGSSIVFTWICEERCRTPLSTSVGLGKISKLIFIGDPGDLELSDFLKIRNQFVDQSRSENEEW